jgi:cell pole-organizing protein PopZ
MALQETQAEPSMEEILASIRRIISEDDAPPAEPLELSTPATEAPAPAPTPPPAAVSEDDDLLVFDKAEPPPPAPVRAPPTPMHSETIVSEPVVSATAHAFTRLAGTLRLSDTEGQSLEGVVRELLRPMLRDWLEANLPAIVESKVEAELDRIARLSR